MEIGVRKEDWLKATRATKDLTPTSYEYSCNCAIAQAVKRQWPDGCVSWVHNSGLTYEGIEFVPENYGASVIMQVLVDDFDAGHEWLYDNETIHITLTAVS